MQTVRALVLGGFIWWGVASCGGHSEPTDEPVDITSACAEAARVYCTTLESCEGGYASVVYGSADRCVARWTEAYKRRAESPGAGYGASEIETCSAHQLAQTCQDWIGTLTPGCDFTGTKALGQPCWFGSQCKSGFCDQPQYYSDRNVCGVCAAPLAEGDSCSSFCEGALICAHDATAAGQCVRRGASGESCDAAALCLPGLACAFSAGGATGQCYPATGNEGDPCADEAGIFCDYQRLIYCNALTHTCAVAQTAAPGSLCGTLADGSSAFCGGGTCRKDPGASSGVCVAYLKDGALCNFGPGVLTSCAPPAICASGVCRIVGGALCE